MNADSPLRQLLPLALAAGLLYVASLAVTRLPCWALFALLVPVAWLLWAYWAGNALFGRRLWLTGVTRTESGLRPSTPIKTYPLALGITDPPNAQWMTAFGGW